jgi:exopolysaccharide production protein ExoQ
MDKSYSLDIQKENRHKQWVNRLFYILIVILLLKIAGFFTISENVSVTRVLKVVLRISMTIVVMVLIKRVERKGLYGNFHWRHHFAPALYALYLLMGFASILWSTDPGYSSLQLIMDIESFVFAAFYIRFVLLLNHYYPDSKIRLSALLGHAVFLILTFFVTGMYVAPDEFYRLTHGGEVARLGGYFMNPNELGMLAVVGLSCFCLELFVAKNKVWVFIQMAIILYALIATGSRSSMIGFLLIVFFFIRFSENKKLKVAINVGALLSIPIIIQTIFIKQGDLEEVLSMTGRLPFWQALLTEGLPKEPWHGFGFMRIAYEDSFQGVHTYAGKMTHNTFIQVLMNLGFIGFTIVLFQLFFTLRGMNSLNTKDSKLLSIGIFIPIIINSFTEFGIFGETNFGILFWQLLIFLVSTEFCPVLTKKQIVTRAIYIKQMERKKLWSPHNMELVP